MLSLEVLLVEMAQKLQNLEILLIFSNFLIVFQFLLIFLLIFFADFFCCFFFAAFFFRARVDQGNRTTHGSCDLSKTKDS